jgi:hypothetical protein
MIAAISPSSSSYEDSYNTLKYADRAKSIKSNVILIFDLLNYSIYLLTAMFLKVKKNERSIQLHVTQYEKMISELRSALATANEKVRSLETTREADLPNIAIEVDENEAIGSTKVCSKCCGEASGEQQPVAIDPASTLSLPKLKEAREEWSALFHDRREIQHKLANLEQLEKDFQHKIMLKNQKNDRVEHISLSTLRYITIFLVFCDNLS